MARRDAVSLDGIKEVQRALKANGPEMTKAVRQAVTAAVFDIAKEANQLVPVDTGNLRSTQNVEVKPVGAYGVEGTISYGDTAAPYAIVQHEGLDLWHPPKPPGKTKVGGRSGTGPVEPGTGRGPKYLEYPYLQETGDWPNKLVKRIRALFHFQTAPGAK